MEGVGVETAAQPSCCWHMQDGLLLWRMYTCNSQLSHLYVVVIVIDFISSVGVPLR